jgi:hypothetical protein
MRSFGPALGLLGIVTIAVACSQASPSVPAATASTAVPPAPGASPGASPLPGTTIDRVAAFFDHIRDPDASYRLDETYELTLGTEHQTTISHAEVAGGDSLYVSDSVAGDTKRHEETATVDGMVYRQVDAGPWTVVGPQEDPGNAFAFLGTGTDGLIDQGRGLAAGLLLNHLSLVAPIQIDRSFTEALGVTGGQTDIVRFDVYAEADGRPVVIDYGFAVADSNGSTVGIGSYHDDFTDFGADDIVIEAPITR